VTSIGLDPLSVMTGAVVSDVSSTIGLFDFPGGTFFSFATSVFTGFAALSGDPTKKRRATMKKKILFINEVKYILYYLFYSNRWKRKKKGESCTIQIAVKYIKRLNKFKIRNYV
jgi:hypothetical protein